VPQTPSHRPTAKRIRNFAKKMRREPTDAEAAMWRLLRTGDWRFSSFGGSSRSGTSFSISFASTSASSSRSMAVSTRPPHAMLQGDAVLTAEAFDIARYWNNDVLQRPSAVLEDILAKLA
jgi:very-short-patch-repair endonuclease